MGLGDDPVCRPGVMRQSQGPTPEDPADTELGRALFDDLIWVRGAVRHDLEYRGGCSRRARRVPALSRSDLCFLDAAPAEYYAHADVDAALSDALERR